MKLKNNKGEGKERNFRSCVEVGIICRFSIKYVLYVYVYVRYI
jgi:hypothetical protein